ncbi:WYL domain-containing protein [Lactobacillus taiwanensis]|uniref:hypothetical protein n=1 Tax=Lactobacillus taiwanensis TaxID=508451 RepID=UPI00211B3BD8|nr:hypothetical protein [Lactobacillus taiwanensis]
MQSSQNSNKEQNFQLLDLFFQVGNWFCHAYNEKSATWKILKLDKFQKVAIAISQDSLINRKELVASFKQYEAWVVM